MRIGIDCRMAGSSHAGIGRYISELVTQLLGSDSSDEWVLFFRDSAQATQVLGKRRPAAVQVIYADVRHYSVKEQIVLPGVFAQAKLDLLHVPHFNVPFFYRGPLIITIHDLLWHDHRGTGVTTLPAWQYWLKYGFYRLVTGRAIAHARVILVPTRTVEKIVQSFYPKTATKTMVTYEGYDNHIFTSAISAKLQSAPAKRLLYVGSLYPHKNIDVVLRALQQLPEFSLDIVSARSVFQDRVAQRVTELGIAKQVTFLGYLPDKPLRDLYQRAYAIICPSLSEGFGLPGIEAMASGGSVVASDIPIFREVYRKAAVFFSPTSAESLTKALIQLTPSFRNSLRQRASGLLTRYSWQDMAAKTIAAYHQALPSPKP